MCCADTSLDLFEIGKDQIVWPAQHFRAFGRRAMRFCVTGAALRANGMAGEANMHGRRSTCGNLNVWQSPSTWPAHQLLASARRTLPISVACAALCTTMIIDQGILRGLRTLSAF